MTGTQIFSRINAVHEKKSCCKLRNCLAALINGTIVCSVSSESSFYVSPKFFLLPRAFQGFLIRSVENVREKMHSQPNVKLLSILDLCAVFFLFLAIGTSSFANATEVGATTIDAVPPRQPSVFYGNAWSIYLDGIIDQTTANKVEQLIISQNIPHLSTIFFNSPGGSLYGGMELGRIIRKYRLVTSVGSKPIVNDSASLNKQIGATCFSACALAYLGGVFRNMDDKSRYGVHRFYIKEDIYLSADMAQIISGEIVSYLRSMDIDTDLFNLSTRAGAQDIFQPGLQMLKKLNVVNNGFTKPTWSLETTNGMLYLKGERDSIYGINKFASFENRVG